MKQDIQPKNDNFKSHGLCLIYADNGNIWHKGHYICHIKYGYFIDNWVINRNIFKSQITFYLK